MAHVCLCGDRLGRSSVRSTGMSTETRLGIFLAKSTVARNVHCGLSRPSRYRWWEWIVGSSGQELEEGIKVGATLDPILDALDVNLGNYACGIFVCICVGACVHLYVYTCMCVHVYV